MLNEKSIRTINEIKFNKNFIKPLYESYNITKILEIIKYNFSIENEINFPKDLVNIEKRKQKIILFLIDGFGWRFIEKFQSHPFIKWAIKNGILSKITSQFPSTTAAHVTLFHSGLTVGQSGIYEWNYYEPKVDNLISPLIFSFSGDKKRNTLKIAGIKSSQIYPNKTFYQFLKKHRIKSFIFQYHDYTPSTYSDYLFRGANVFPYKTLTEAITKLFQVLNNENEQSYYFLYFDVIDSISHQYGPNSTQLENEILIFLDIMEKIFLPNFTKLKNVIFMMTADHGHVEVDPKTCFYLNKKIPSIKKYLKTNKKGELLIPAGSPRDMFLYIKEEYLPYVKKILEKKLNGMAEIFETKQLIKDGFFGKKISKKFLERVGNLVILPYKNQLVWWYEKGRFEQKFFGHHGGLTKEEMEINLFFIKN
jgi:predicted AlkP superfamily pyrophosphatase or phosphodiesterase